MPRRSIKQVKNKKINKKIFESHKEPPSTYKNFFYGALTVVLLLVVFFGFFRISSERVKQNIADEGIKISRQEENQEKKGFEKNKEYVVLEGETLWSISEKFYNSGYNWPEIAKVNNLSNPDVLIKGTKIIIPEIQLSIQKNTEDKFASNVLSADSSINIIEKSEYLVQEGDTLWGISVRAYGDGYKWTEVARENKLSNPDIIHPGNKIILPR